MKSSIFTVLSVILVSCSSYAGNARISPLSLLVGSIDGDVTFSVNDHFTAGPTFSLVNFTFGDTKISGQAFGIRVNYFPTFMPSDDGMYFGGEFSQGNVKVDVVDSGSGEASFSGFTGLIGYQWVYDNGFNLNLGGGFSSASASEVILTSTSGNQTTYSGTGVSSAGLALEFGIGMIF